MHVFKEKAVLLTLLIILLSSCQDTFDGKSEQIFMTSRHKIEENLSTLERNNLEKAMRVIAIESMRLMWNNKKFKEKTSNDISLELVDGLTFSATIDLAEKILHENKQREINQLESDIESLSQRKKELDATLQLLNVFKIKSIELVKEDWFGDMVPKMKIEYQYVGSQNLKGQTESEGLQIVQTDRGENSMS